jgi:hypothetical protein
MEATGSTYESSRGALDWVDTSLKGQSRPCVRSVALAILDTYPNARQQQFDSLLPRQWGEFLVTGCIERWGPATGKG